MNDLKKIDNSVEEAKRDGETAATFVEYILLVSLIAIAVIAVLSLFGQRASIKFSQLSSSLN